jgi:endonuclease/exonuclease/phosphatase family metal-dependent hydrolase
MRDAAPYRHVIIAGDMNNHGIGDQFTASGYRWVTQHDPATIHWFNWDHVFIAGFAAGDSARVGVIRDNRGASDHRPVWAVIALSHEAPITDLRSPPAAGTPGP